MNKQAAMVGQVGIQSVKQHEIPHQVGQISESIYHLRESIDALTARIGPVLSSPSDSADSMDVPSPLSATDLGGQLAELRSRIGFMNNIVQDALNRLEL